MTACAIATKINAILLEAQDRMDYRGLSGEGSYDLDVLDAQIILDIRRGLHRHQGDCPVCLAEEQQEEQKRIAAGGRKTVGSVGISSLGDLYFG